MSTSVSEDERAQAALLAEMSMDELKAPELYVTVRYHNFVLFVSPSCPSVLHMQLVENGRAYGSVCVCVRVGPTKHRKQSNRRDSLFISQRPKLLHAQAATRCAFLSVSFGFLLS